jgi:hypothetical protein
MAGMAAQIVAPRTAKRNTTIRWRAPGRSNETAAIVAVSIPTKYWPSTPMLNIPARKATATARPEKINGVARSSTRATSWNRAVEKSTTRP